MLRTSPSAPCIGFQEEAIVKHGRVEEVKESGQLSTKQCNTIHFWLSESVKKAMSWLGHG